MKRDGARISETVGWPERTKRNRYKYDLLTVMSLKLLHLRTFAEGANLEDNCEIHR